MSDLAIDQQIAMFLALCRTATLATVDRAGLPCAANIQYASDDAWRLYWVSSATSAHSLNLHDQPQSAMTIYSHQDLPEMIHGLQMRGTAQVLRADDAAQAITLYTRKYPFVAQPPYRDALAKQSVYRFTPSWLRWVDNRRGFGFKRELTI